MPGFLSTRATFMLDFVFVALFAILPLLAFSIRLAKHGHYEWHKRVQVTLAIVLLVTVGVFEIDLNYLTKDWRPLAEPSPSFASGWVDYGLWIHLLFAVPTPLVWIFVIVQALRKFPRPAAPNSHSPKHARWGWLASGLLTLTAITGWIFYYLAFVA
jgi:uncharacterized membrane protein YozB (DUF420 family)